MSAKNLKKGFIVLPRSSFDDFLWTEPRVFSKWEAWTDLIRLAGFEGSKILIGSTLVETDRGELCGSLRYLAKRWNWKKDKTNSFIKLLVKDERIRQVSRQGQTVIQVLKYDVYQTIKNYFPDSNPDSGPTTNRQVADKYKEIQTSKNIEYISFDEFWSLYPKKTTKAKSQELWSKLKVDDSLFVEIKNSILAHQKSKQWQDPQFIPDPRTWLNQRRWEDEINSKEQTKSNFAIYG